MGTRKSRGAARFLYRNAALAEYCRARIRLNGRTFSGWPIWTPKEDKLIRSIYPDYVKLRRLLQNRTLGAICMRARALGVATKYHRWTPNDVSTLRKQFSTGEISVLMKEFPGVSWVAIYKKGRSLGLLHPRLRIKPVGNLVLDLIRHNAATRAWSMVDLDEIAGTKTYYRTLKKDQCNPRIDYILKAIAALEGRLAVRKDGFAILKWKRGPEHVITEFDRLCQAQPKGRKSARSSHRN
jgi:hypothetical protein